MRKFLFLVLVVSGFRVHGDFRIIGGQPVSGVENPWQLSLKSKMGSHFCGAVLIAEDVAITAAHCIWSDGPGDFSVQGQSATGRLQETRPIGSVARIVVHPLFDRQSFTAHDLALIFLKSPVAVSESLRPIEIVPESFPFQLEQDFHSLQSDSFETTGWGVVTPPNLIEDPSPQLLGTQQKPIASSNVSLFFEEVKQYLLAEHDIGDRTIARISAFEARTLVMDGFGTPSATCSGDSGGPLVMNFVGKKVLVGLSSYTAGGDRRCLGVSVYTNLQAYRSWVEAEISSQRHFSTNRRIIAF